MFNNLNLQSANSIEIGNALSEIFLLKLYSEGNFEQDNNLYFLNKAKELMYISLSALTYLRDIKKENITIKDVYNMFHVDCFLTMISDSEDEVLKDNNLNKYLKFYIPEDYQEDTTGIHPKRILKHLAEYLKYKKEMTEEETFVFNRNYLFVSIFILNPLKKYMEDNNLFF